MASVTVKLRYLRHSAKKLRPVGRQFVGKNLENAINATSVMSPDSARYLNRALRMAKAAAQSKEINPETAVITEIAASDGPKIKRMRPNSRGRSNRYIKHVAHLSVLVSSAPESAPKKPAKATEKNVSVTKETNGPEN